MTKRSQDFDDLNVSKIAKIEEHKCIQDVEVVASDGNLNVCRCKLVPSEVLTHAITLNGKLELSCKLHTIKQLLDGRYQCNNVSDMIDLYSLAHKYGFSDITTHIEFGHSCFMRYITGAEITRIWSGNFTKLMNIVFSSNIDDIKDWSMPTELCKMLDSRTSGLVIDKCKTGNAFIKCFMGCGEMTDTEILILAKKHLPVKVSWRKHCSLACSSGCMDHIITNTQGLILNEDDYKFAPYDNKYFAKYLAMRLQLEIKT